MTRDISLYTVAKKCYECGVEWEGMAFHPQPADAPRLPGICAACIAKDAARTQELTRPMLDARPADVELAPPRHVAEHDDVIPIDRKMLAAGDDD